MGSFFVNIQLYIAKRRMFFAFFSVILIALLLLQLVNIKFNEDVNSIIPQDIRIDEISDVFNSSKLSDRIIFNISLSDTAKIDDNLLVRAGESVVNILSEHSNYIESLEFKINESDFFQTYDFIYNNLPLYLTDEDYKEIESYLTDTIIENKIQSGYRALISPVGVATKKYFFKDPLNLVPLALKKLQKFQIDENFTIYNSCIFTKDKKNLLIFIDPYFPANNTKENVKFVDIIKSTINIVESDYQDVQIEYYGGTIVAVENSIQIKKDILLTISVSLILLSILFLAFFKKLRIVAFLFVPVVIGALVSLVLLSLIVGEVSLISLGIGAILLCISIDFSLHLVTHNRETGKILETIKNVSSPIIISSITTGSALLCIFILKSEALKQLSLFAAIGIVSTAIAALIILPILIKYTNIKSEVKSASFFDKLINRDIHKNGLFVLIIIVLSIVFSFTLKNLKFNSDISTLNYQSLEVTKAENNLKSISSEANSGVFVFTHASNIEDALLKTEDNIDFLKTLVYDDYAISITSASDLIMSKKAQSQKANTWNDFWSDRKKDYLKNTIIKTGSKYNIKDNAFNEFHNLLNKDFVPLDIDDFEILISVFLSNYLNKVNDKYYIASMLRTNNKIELINKISSNDDFMIYDKLLLINKLMDILKEDFNKLSLLSIVVVFGLILLFFGRIELAIIAFIPIAIGWIWTLGLMSVFEIEFNIFNIIVSSFIFGLGLDYSIFLVSGHINNYKYGSTSISAYKLSVLLSALTTICGFGVLILAKHPALKSIAIVSIFGVVSVLIISFTIIPYFFNVLIKIKDKKRREPIKFKNTIISVASLSIFIFGTLIMTVLVPMLYIIPFKSKYKKMFMCQLIREFSKFVVSINITIKRKYIDMHKLDFSKPSVIISNHQSHLDLVLILMLHPKIIVFTNKWVWNNIFYGFIIRYADYFPAYRGIDKGFENVRRKVREGYSILIFPEGKRTINGEINRFHQGAFNISYELNIDIQPIIIHGAFQSLPKDEFFLKSGHITMKFLDKIKPIPIETEHGITFKEQAKEITAFYRKEFAQLRLERETTDFFKNILISQYIYKGPVLEWYLRVKIMLEKNYSLFNNIIPDNAHIIDIGCGYGFLAHMLKMTSNQRQILGIDYDEEKIKIANNIPAISNGIEFKVLDISENDIPNGEVYIMNDVLHYLPENIQVNVLKQCIEKLPDNGKIIIREANADMKKRTVVTKITEIQSTKIFKFNKTKYKLTYISFKLITEIANNYNLTCEILDNAKFTSNMIYILSKKHVSQLSNTLNK